MKVAVALDKRRERHRCPKDRDLALVASHDGCLSCLVERAYQSVILHGGYRRLVTLVLRLPRDVPHGVIAIVCKYSELLVIVAGEDSLNRHDFEPLEGGR